MKALASNAPSTLSPQNLYWDLYFPLHLELFQKLFCLLTRVVLFVV